MSLPPPTSALNTLVSTALWLEGRFLSSQEEETLSCLPERIGMETNAL